MANKEALNFQEALAKKIKAWEKTADFAEGSTNRQKINRSLNLLLGSDPEVIIDMLGGDFVPKNPREAMNLIRNLDLKTLKQMEILPLQGLGDKLVGHHGIAASTMHALRGMKPTERLKVYEGLSEMGQRFGMDPKQIFLIADKVHKSVAHGGDFKGVKTGVTLPYIVGETGDEFLRRFEEPMQKQLAMLEQAINAGDTQKYYQAINVVEDNLKLPKGTLIDPNTPLELKGAATKLLEPAASQVRDIVNTSDDIPGGVQKVLDNTPFKPRALQNFQNLAVQNGVIKFGTKFGVGLTGLGVLFDAGDSIAGVSDVATKSGAQQLSGGLQAVQGLTGLASLKAGPMALPSVVASGYKAAIDTRLRKDAEIQEKLEYESNVLSNGPKPVMPKDGSTATLERTKPRWSIMNGTVHLPDLGITEFLGIN